MNSIFEKFSSSNEFERLPNEILNIISSYFKIKDLGRVETLSKFWNNRIRNSEFWKSLVLNCWKLESKDVDEENWKDGSNNKTKMNWKDLLHNMPLIYPKMLDKNQKLTSPPFHFGKDLLNVQFTGTTKENRLIVADAPFIKQHFEPKYIVPYAYYDSNSTSIRYKFCKTIAYFEVELKSLTPKFDQSPFLSLGFVNENKTIIEWRNFYSDSTKKENVFGVGKDWENNSVIFTRDGKLITSYNQLDSLFYNPKLFPSVLIDIQADVKFNFFKIPFRYDILNHNNEKEVEK